MKLKTKALVLGGFPFGESHKVISFLTPYKGILKGVAHGVRKPTSKFGSSMEIFNELEIILHLSKKNDLHSIKEHSVIKSRHEIRENKNILGYLFYLSEFIKEFFRYTNESEYLYKLINIFLENTNEKDAYLLFRALLLKIIKESGFLGNLNQCSDCGNINDELYISKLEGFFFCSKCRKNNFSKQISKGVLKLLQILDTENDQILKRLKSTEAQKKEMDNIFNVLTNSILGKTLKSESYIHLNLV